MNQSQNLGSCWTSNSKQSPDIPPSHCTHLHCGFIAIDQLYGITYSSYWSLKKAFGFTGWTRSFGAAGETTNRVNAGGIKLWRWRCNKLTECFTEDPLQLNHLQPASEETRKHHGVLQRASRNSSKANNIEHVHACSHVRRSSESEQKTWTIKLALLPWTFLHGFLQRHTCSNGISGCTSIGFLQNWWRADYIQIYTKFHFYLAWWHTT